MSDRKVWFIAETANPAEAYDSAFYAVEEVARRHCRNLVGNTGRSVYEVYEAVVTLVTRPPAPDVSRLLAAAKEAFGLIRELERDEQSWDPDGDLARRLHGASLRLEAALDEPAARTPGPDASRLLAAAKGLLALVYSILPCDLDPRNDEFEASQDELEAAIAEHELAVRPAQPSDIDVL